uniref:Uncharacterized protein n=1 Tax=Oryza glumipatula TaxID=40148 RepID=A0A0E0BGE3_9ORYZ
MATEQCRAAAAVARFLLANSVGGDKVEGGKLMTMGRRVGKIALTLSNMLCEDMKAGPDRVLVLYDQTS